MSNQKAITKVLKGIPAIRSAQRMAIAAKADANHLASEVILRVPVIEVDDPLLGGSEERTISYPKYYQELTGRHWEHYNVKPISKEEFEGVWCELIISKDIADQIVKNHSDAKIVLEEEDKIV